MEKVSFKYMPVPEHTKPFFWSILQVIIIITVIITNTYRGINICQTLFTHTTYIHVCMYHISSISRCPHSHNVALLKLRCILQSVEFYDSLFSSYGTVVIVCAYLYLVALWHDWTTVPLNTLINKRFKDLLRKKYEP